MTVKNTMHQPFGYQDVQNIIDTIPPGTNELKEKATHLALDTLDVSALPERVRTWIHRLCLYRLNPDMYQPFNGKIAEPIDIASLPKRNTAKK